EQTAAQVFSRRAYAWDGLAAEDVAVIPPCIDAFSPKNQDLAQDQVDSILRVAGLVPGEGDGANGDATFERQDGTPGMVHIEAELVEDDPIPTSAQIVTQVSRWDRLKDPVGVLHGFARHVDI